jgi:hypothetical protein
VDVHERASQHLQNNIKWLMVGEVRWEATSSSKTTFIYKKEMLVVQRTTIKENIDFSTAISLRCLKHGEE